MPGPLHPDTALRHSPHPSSTPSGRPRAAGARESARAAGAGTELKAACEDLEALFIHHMLSEMRKTVETSGLIDGGRSEEIYTSLMDAELAREMARSGGLGLSTILQEQLRGLPSPPRGAVPKR